jgi:mycofactocin precursor
MTLRAVIVRSVAASKEIDMAEAPAVVDEHVEDVEDIEDLVEDETLVEEVSIDGMCGVY